jgi:hypothetical protein
MATKVQAAALALSGAALAVDGVKFIGDTKAALIADFVAITGGEAPTEAEFNALGAKVNAILAVLKTTHGLMASA